MVASLQFTPVALFDSALTDELAGVAAGMALMVVVVWVINRLRHG